MNLRISNLSKTYPNGTEALKHVSLDIPRGMFGLLGRNGAGKSTLMRIWRRDETEVQMDDVVDVESVRAGGSSR